MSQEVLLGAYVFILAIFVGFEVIARVPSILHTPLMSATNAIHGIVLLGAMLIAGAAKTPFMQAIAFVAVIAAFCVAVIPAGRTPCIARARSSDDP